MNILSGVFHELRFLVSVLVDWKSYWFADFVKTTHKELSRCSFVIVSCRMTISWLVAWREKKGQFCRRYAHCLIMCCYRVFFYAVTLYTKITDENALVLLEYCNAIEKA